MLKLKTVYVFRGSEETLTCAKLDRDLNVVDVYAITKIGTTTELTCNCPSRYIPCKHVKLLKVIQQHFAEDLLIKYWIAGPHGKDVQGYTYAEIIALLEIKN